MNASTHALLTDLYQLTMAYGLWKLARAQDEAVFHLTFRRNPFGGGYALAAGLEPAVTYLEGARFTPDDLAYLAGLAGGDGERLFDPGFLELLANEPLRLDVDAVPEATPVFPHEPLLRVRGPLWQCMLVETPLLNIVNFQTLVATKAARVCAAADGDPVLEFGLRRAQGTDGALAASRAAYLGGCSATSNVLAGARYGIPVKGTHAHSWVMAFDDEPSAFRAYAEAMPNNAVLLVDTYDTEEGVRRAIIEAHRLRAAGHELLGVRLDSGDLCELSLTARRLLDEAGFPDAAVVASNDLDEYEITALKGRGAAIGVWGVGTRLVTAYDQPALGGVYKLAAIRGPGEAWEHRVKLSDTPIKVSNPGMQQVRRYRGPDGAPLADVIVDELAPLPSTLEAVATATGEEIARFEATEPCEELLIPVQRAGETVWTSPPLAVLRRQGLAAVASLPSGLRRLRDPDRYPVGLERGLHATRAALIAAADKDS